MLLWVFALAGYAQTFSVTPKALQCTNVPTWPITHTKKPNNLQLNATTKTTNAGATAAATKPTTAVPAIPLIKLWLMTDDDN